MMKAKGYANPNYCFGLSIPTPIQNMYIRQYCRDNGISVGLSTHELFGLNNFPQLQVIAEQSSSFDLLVCVSLFFFPPNTARRERLLNIFLRNKCCVYGILENVWIRNLEDINNLNEMVELKKIEEAVAFQFSKNGKESCLSTM